MWYNQRETEYAVEDGSGQQVQPEDGQSRYGKQQTRRVIVSGLKWYEAARSRAKKSGIRMHRSTKAGAEGRNIKKLLAKTSWYKERDLEAAGEAELGEELFDRYMITLPCRAS